MMPGAINRQWMYEWFEDFFDVDTTNRLTLTNDGATGTNTLDATAGGTYTIKTAAADNDYHLLSSKAASIALAAAKPVWFEARVKLTEAATNAANIIVGLTDTLTSGNLQNDGAGPASSHDGIVLYKVDGGTTWALQSSNGSTQTSTTAIATFGSGNWQRIGFHFEPLDTTNAYVTAFFYDETTAVRVVSVKQRVALSGLGPCYVVAGVKAGGATAENLIVDYLRCVAKR